MDKVIPSDAKVVVVGGANGHFVIGGGCFPAAATASGHAIEARLSPICFDIFWTILTHLMWQLKDEKGAAF